MADISFNFACKELKITQIAQLNQHYQLLHLVHIYGYGFYESSRMLMRKNVNNDVSKDSPMRGIKGTTPRFPHLEMYSLIFSNTRFVIRVNLLHS